jgi:phage-related protein (TIGR01555 family)
MARKKQASDNEMKLNSLNDFISGFTGGQDSFFGSELSKANTLAWNNRYSALTLNRSLVSTLYQEHGIVQVLVDQPVDDAFRGGITILSDELDEDDLKRLYKFIDENNILLTYAQALKWGRLYGGSGVIINSGQDPSKELDIDSIKETTPLEFYAADRWELSYTPAGMGLDQFATDELACPYNYYGHRLNKTHIIKLNGKIAPSLIRGQFGGWGVSELERLVRPYNQFLKHQDVVFELLDESKVDVFKIQGFNSSIASRDGAMLTSRRINVASKIKNYQNALVVDKEDDYEQKTLAFGGLSEILTQIRIDLASECRMPMTKLFGLSASGFNSGEDDIENYNAMIESEIRSKIKQGLMLMLKISAQKLFGFVPEHLEFQFKPLRMMSEKDESQLKTEQLGRVLEAYRSGLMSVDGAVSQINTSKIFPVDINEAETVSLDEMADSQVLPAKVTI